KMLDECQDRRSCQVLVNSRVFGTDQCPGSSKYLIVWYKCRPNEYKSKVVCEEEQMRLNCKEGMQISVYSAMFGRTQRGTLECPPHFRRAPSVGETHSHYQSPLVGCAVVKGVWSLHTIMGGKADALRGWVSAYNLRFW
ncbi:hypothetical protein XENORESO_000439, partial [Xenotaenia resolanae]